MGKRHTSTSRPKGTLQIKILSGYLLLTLLVGGIVYAVWHEKRVFQKAEQEERAMLGQRKLTNDAFKSLIALLLHSDGALLWDKDDLRSYEEKDRRMSEILEKLGDAYPDSLQQLRIDTVRSLLAEKKAQIYRLTETPSTVSRMDSLLSERLPPLEQSASVPDRVVSAPVQESEKKSKKSFWNWFKPKKKKGKDGNEGAHGASTVRVVPNPRHVRDMRQFRDDVFAALREQKAMYRALSDSLERRNRLLNRHINRLVNDFERDAMQRTEERLQRVSALREQAFALICAISSAGLLCALLLYVFIYRDIRHKYRDRRKLEDSNRKRYELLEIRKRIIVTLSHDIRGPLNTISGSAELAMDTRDRRRRNAYLENILDAARHIMRLANSLLDLSRLDEAKETLNPVPFRLVPFLDGMADEYTRPANDKGLLFSKDVDVPDIVVSGDADRLEQVLDNLLSNAVKFTKSGSVSFSASYEKEILTVRIQDTGIGMDGKTVERIFQPFERAAPEVDAEGFGLGLAITRGLVSLLKGEISVSSRPGEGSSFEIRIPLSPTDEPVKGTAVPVDGRLSLPQRVLVVDDDPIQLRIVGEMLERNGVSCCKCQNAQAVVNELRRTRYDIILTDIQMRGTGGFALLYLLRHSNIGNSRTVPVAAMTARNDGNDSRYWEAGFSGCIRKPFSMNELLAFLSSVTEKKKAVPPASADFSALAADIEDRKWILETFIGESLKNKAELQESLSDMEVDFGRVRETLHRMYPAWEQLGIAHELDEYSEILQDDGPDGKAVHRHTEDMVGRICRLIAEAERLLSEMEDGKQETIENKEQ